ncbi:TPA: hypothetical protein ACHJH6_004558 [Klebsiella pneumoniae]
MFNADWNEEKIAVEDSLKKNNHYNIGLNAYGSAFYGDYIFNWLKTSGIESYGIPEVHPMIKTKKSSMMHWNIIKTMVQYSLALTI